MYEPMVSVQLSDRRDEFGIFGRRSFLRVRRILVAAPSTYRLRIARISHDQPDQNYAKLARTIESVKR